MLCYISGFHGWGDWEPQVSSELCPTVLKGFAVVKKVGALPGLSKFMAVRGGLGAWGSPREEGCME